MEFPGTRGLTVWTVAGLFVAAGATAQLPIPNALPTPAAETEAADPYQRETPHDCFLGFLRAAHAGNYAYAAQYIQWPKSHERPSRDVIARQLAVVLDQRFIGNPDALSRSRTGTLDDGLPADQEKAGALVESDGHIDVVLVRVPQAEGGDLWLISWETVREALRIHTGLVSAELEKRLPSILVDNRVASMPLWQAIGVVLLLPILYLVSWLVVASCVWIYRFFKRPAAAASTTWSASARQPITFLLTLMLHRVGVFLLGLPLLYRLYYGRLVNVLVVLGVGWLLLRLIDLVGGRLVHRLMPATEASAFALFRLGRRIFKALVAIVIVVVALTAMGINLTPTLAGLGIGGIAIAFAAQKSLENVFGGMSVLGDRVIRIGDTCRIGKYQGEIEDITLYATRLRTLERTLVHIPNGALATQNIENLSRRDKFWFHPVIGLRYETSAEQMRQVLGNLRSMLAEDPRVEPGTTRVRFIHVGAYSLDVEVFAYVRAGTEADFLAVQEELLLKIMDVVEKAGTDIAFPSQTSYVGRDRMLGAWEPAAKPADPSKEGGTP